MRWRADRLRPGTGAMPTRSAAEVGHASASASSEDASPIRLVNRSLVLSFDRQTGAWIGLHDAPAGDDLIVSPASKAMLLPPPIRKLDWPVLQQAVESTIRVPERLVANWRDRLSAETVRATPSFHLAMAPGQIRVLVRGEGKATD